MRSATQREWPKSSLEPELLRSESLSQAFPGALDELGRAYRRRRPSAPARARRDDDVRLAGAAGEAADLQATHGLEDALGLVCGQRLQLRPRLLTHRGADARGDRAAARGGTAADRRAALPER